MKTCASNWLSIYLKDNIESENSFTFVQNELNLYGSNRIGVYKVPSRSMTDNNISRITTRYRNYRHYENSNHLGNIMTVYSDRVKGILGQTQQKASYYEADLVSANDYYPFGQVMRTRHYPNNGGVNGFFARHRYGFNGKEADYEGEINTLNTYDYGFRIYNPGIARFLSVDPLTKKFAMLTPFQFASNTPIQAIDLDGLEAACINHYTTSLVIVVQGMENANPDREHTQVQNDKYNKSGIEINGLSRIYDDAKDKPEIQVVVFSSSTNEFTKKDITTTIREFKKMNPNGNVIVTGHSLGADNLVEMARENTDLTIDHMILLDLADPSWDTDNISSNVKSVNNYFVPDKSLLGSNPGGEEIEIDDPKQTTGKNIPKPNSTHTSIDQDMQNDVSKEILNKVSDLDKAKRK